MEPTLRDRVTWLTDRLTEPAT